MKTIEDLKTGDEICVFRRSTVQVYLFKSGIYVYFMEKNKYDLMNPSIYGRHEMEWVPESYITILKEPESHNTIPQEPKYIPFTSDDHLLFRDKWMNHKSDNLIFKIQGYDVAGIFRPNTFYNYTRAYEELAFEDGTPFGKLNTGE